MSQSFPLARLQDGQSGLVSALRSSGAMRRRLLDLGLIPGTQVTCLGHSPAGDPAAYLIRGAVIALRGRDAAEILLDPAPAVPPRRGAVPV